MAPRGYFTTGSLSAFIFLGVIRGSFSVAIYFAVHSYRSPSLVFLLRTPGSVALYAVLMIFLSSRDSEIKQTFYNNFRNVRNYWKFAVMGLVQLAAPYMLYVCFTSFESYNCWCLHGGRSVDFYFVRKTAIRPGKYLFITSFSVDLLVISVSR